ncbi:PREDICTED: uncharacterized protein LOC108569730 [Nicrophorus vespilloides]|uniref:Uncharacterized protein LOC108569730 n=1 Tax=Nicrophorus vespilloides TaxID=110193 RepID=A0ABM1NJ82_NICVS|nr:PREDICTED: uncharacterized protein LOC108569730 [Nicrophorus vespilloides]
MHLCWKFVWEDFGFWNSTFKKSPVLLHLSDRRHDLNGTNMNVGFLFDDNDTWNHLEDYKYPRIDTFTKQNYLTIKALMEYCNINMTIVSADVWGYYNATTKNWNGLVEKVRSNEVQISGSSPFFTAQRFQVVDYIKMQNPLTIQFVMKRPPVSSVYNLFTLPFNANVWRCLGITILIFVVAIYITYNWESRTNINFSQKGSFSFSDVIVVISEVMCQQGTLTVPESTPSRILVIFLFTSFMFIYSSYSAYITVVLQSTFKITSYHTLIHSQMKVGAMNTTYMPYYVSQSESKIEAQLYKKKIGPKGFYSLEEGMKKVQSGFFAFHCEIAAAFDYISKEFTEHETCRIQTLYGYTEHMQGYTMVPKNSAYKKIFKVGLMRIEEYGIQKRNYYRYFRTPKCYVHGGEFQSVGLLETFNAFMLLIGGCSISFVLWMVEVARYRRANRKANQESMKPKSTKGEKNDPQVSESPEVIDFE